MILTFAIIALISVAGASITYLYEKEDSLMARLAAGNVIGSAILGTVGFIAACVAGLSAATVVVSLLITLAPLAILFVNKPIRKEFRHDVAKAKGKTQGTNLKKTIRFFYHAFILLLLWFFFERAMIETDQGIFTGASQNLGDLPFHLGAIYSFSDGNNFPPSNPSFAGAKFTYPFLADLITAEFVKLGIGVRQAMLVQNVLLGFSLFVLLEKFVIRITGVLKTGKIAVLILLFSGGLGFVWFAHDYWTGSKGFFELLWNLERDYTIGEKFRWGNSLVVLFITQRSLLFGMPLTLIALTKLWDVFVSERSAEPIHSTAGKQADKTVAPFSLFHFSPFSLFPFSPFNLLPFFPFSLFLVGLLAGTLPLIHVHSLAVLFVVCAFLFFFRLDKWRDWIAFGVGVVIVAAPELAWSLTGSASNLKEFIGWHFGWDLRNDNFLFFWLKNLGIFIPLLAAGLFLISRGDETHPDARRKTQALLFFIPFAFLFLVSNTVKLAPWEWDNIKVLIYWYVGSLPFVALTIAWAWDRQGAFRAAALAAFLLVTLSGMLDVWRTVSAQISYSVFSHDSVRIAEQIRAKTAPNAMFLNAPTYNSAVVLTGRRSLMRYSGHLSSYGIDYAPREADVKRIYTGSPNYLSLLEKYSVDYVIISPEETANLSVRREAFDRFPTIAEIGDYRVVKVK
ncbi:MAG TPA: hypothetical protein PKO33_04510 [Pyrinomonadaceae bacterium]|nr:hypothetical protein [Pyrinomonadaceae bacterium]